MTQKYGKEQVFSPGTVIISAGAEVSDVKKTVSQVLVNDEKSAIFLVVKFSAQNATPSFKPIRLDQVMAQALWRSGW